MPKSTTRLAFVVFAIHIALCNACADHRVSDNKSSARIATTASAEERYGSGLEVELQNTSHRSGIAKLPAVEKYAALPLTFEANQGQTNGHIQFLSRGAGRILLLMSDRLLLSFPRWRTKPAESKSIRRQPLENSQWLLRRLERGTERSAEIPSVSMRFVGANPTSKLTGVDRAPATTNYFIGRDPKQWRRSIPNYYRVCERDIYPGIDLVYYGNRQELEYDFLVSPGADPRSITLAFDNSAGHQSHRRQISAQGDLLVEVGDREIRFRRPVAYQLLSASGTQKQFIETRYIKKGNNQITFAVGAYDATRPLVIDPVLSYSTYLGGSGDEVGGAIAVDLSGNTYVIGSTGSADFPTTSGSIQPTFAGGVVADGPSFGGDAFITKLSPHGSLIYSTYLGGSAGEFGNSISVDSSGNAYVTGFTRSTDFPTTPGALQTACKVSDLSGCGEAFVAKLDPTGAKLVYSTYLGGNGDDYGIGISPDRFGNAYVVGYTESVDFPVTAGAFQQSCAPVEPSLCNIAFVTKLNDTGSALVYSTYLGGSGGERFSQQGYSIAVDSTGTAYVTGFTDSASFPTTAGSFQTACNLSTSGGCSFDGFVTKLDATGSRLLYSTYLGGSDFDQALHIALDHGGNAYVTGYTASNNFPTTAGALQTTCGSAASGFCSDAFVTKLNHTGSAPVYSTYLGGSGDEVGAGIDVSPSGNAFVTGGTNSVDFPTVRAFQPTFAGVADAFIAELGRSGSNLVYASYLGGAGDDFSNGVALHGSGSAYLTGNTSSTDFPARNAIQSTFAGGTIDVFIVKIGPANTGCGEDEPCF